jgi:hypothetical protein
MLAEPAKVAINVVVALASAWWISGVSVKALKNDCSPPLEHTHTQEENTAKVSQSES